MGYGYGVWLVLEINGVKTHIPHATIACNMTKDDAFTLYHEFIELNGTKIRCTIDLSDYVILPPNYYANSKDELYGWAWAYNANIIAAMPSDQKNLDLPEKHHISMQYEKEKTLLCPEGKDMVYSLIGRIEVVDIRSDIPSEWNIITRELQ